MAQTVWYLERYEKAATGFRIGSRVRDFSARIWKRGVRSRSELHNLTKLMVRSGRCGHRIVIEPEVAGKRSLVLSQAKTSQPSPDVQAISRDVEGEIARHCQLQRDVIICL
jgi:hypothetical protein